MAIDRRDFIKTVGAAGAAVTAGHAASAQEERPGSRPNILYIMTDQQPYSCVGTNGNPIIRTPNLDTLAANGCTFDRFYIAAFPCSPSRAAQFSGRYAHNHGVVTNDVMFDADVPCLGDICLESGYDTGYFGKWHLGGNMYRGRDDARGKGLGGNWVFERVEDETGFRFQAVPGGEGEDGTQHGFEKWSGGWEHYHMYLRKVGLGEFLDENPHTGNHNDAPSGPEGKHIYSLLPQEHHMAAFFAEETARFVRARARSPRSWCAVLSFYGPHLPVAPPRPWDEMYSLEQAALPANHRDLLEGKPVRQRTGARNYKLPSWNDDQFKDYIRRYFGYCSYIDQQIGRVFTALRESGQWDNTIIVFTSDHGDMVAAHGMIFKLGTCGYEELYRVPGIVRIPGVTKPGSRTDALTSNIDLLPTLLEAGDIPAPEGIDGKSLMPLLKGETTEHRDIVFAATSGSFICRDDRHKFVLNWRSRDLDELYDLQGDPGEMSNLAYEARHEALAERMRARILQWTRDTGHPYADSIGQQAAKKPETRVLEIDARVGAFEHLGGDEFEMEIIWRVAKPFEAEGKCWAFTQFCNRKYGTDAEIVFRFTPYPDPPVGEWKAGEEYHVGPIKVKVPKHAGPGDYQVRTGLYDPQTKKGPGIILRGQGNAMIVGTLTIEKDGEEITEISYKPK